ncbi:MAG: hydrolase Nlp/P60 [Flavobacteriales bacterium CG18_big_fil_WC_8_21_14_2_50_32_9]|nr:MAG: hydrolase Nlp/P60 [Flavobacteriales bacterium CG18_big_fil_WC_8_21_14_2_50_32_9]PJC62910.1 MAG: hydrolase Nlp/P60 [Flavobacteriales bacterium CG_4_9_14_0_2_um_filter_32_27]
MKFGICSLSVIPARYEPSDKSEMVTQILFGETYSIYEEQRKGWKKIKAAYDNYECWIDEKQSTEISEEDFIFFNNNSNFVTSEVISILKNKKTNYLIPIVIGSSLPNFSNETIHINANEYLFEGNKINTSTLLNKKQLAENAFLFLNTPYLWGGRSPFGIDCSGFTQIIYKLIGFKLPRDAYQQAKIGQTLSFIEESESGDLAFFDNEEGNIIHVGIMLGDNKIIHASGKVRIDSIDHQGIFNPETNRYSHKLRIIKRII